MLFRTTILKVCNKIKKKRKKNNHAGFWIDALTKSLMHTCMFELAQHIHSEAGGIAEACTGYRIADAKKNPSASSETLVSKENLMPIVSISFKPRKKKV